MRLKYGGIFSDYFTTHLLPSQMVKKLKNRSAVGKVMGKSRVSCFSRRGYVW